MMTTAAICTGALDALVNYWLTRIRLEATNAKEGTNFVPECSLTDGADTALYKLLQDMAPSHDLAKAVERVHGFDLGMKVGQFVQTDPFGDPRCRIMREINDAIAERIDGQ